MIDVKVAIELPIPALKSARKAFAEAQIAWGGADSGEFVAARHDLCGQAGVALSSLILDGRIVLEGLPASLADGAYENVDDFEWGGESNAEGVAKQAIDFWLAFLGWTVNHSKLPIDAIEQWTKNVFRKFTPGSFGALGAAPSELETLRRELRAAWPGIFQESCQLIDFLLKEAKPPNTITLPWEAAEEYIELAKRADRIVPVTASDEHAFSFRKAGETWAVVFEGTPLNLIDIVGLHYIAYLLQHPEQDISVVKLRDAVTVHGVLPRMCSRGTCLAVFCGHVSAARSIYLLSL